MLLDKLGNIFTFQTFDDKKDKKANLVATMHGNLTDCGDSLRMLNDAGAGVFFTVNQTDGKGRDSKNIIRVRALYIDLDLKDEHREFTYYLPPSAVVESSPGKHQVYWILNDELPLDEFRSMQKALISAFGSDPKIHDLPRVMRVPGFYHHKNDPFLVRQIIDSGLTYSVAQMKDWLAADIVAEPPTPQPTKHEKIVYRGDDPDAVTEFNNLLLELEFAPEGERNNTLNKVAFRAYGLVKAGRLFKDDVYTALIDMAVSIGLSESEAGTTIRSAKTKSIPVFNDMDLLPEAKPEPVEKSKFGVRLIRGCDEPPEGHEWIWYHWLAKRAIHIMAGAPSTGKTTVCLALAARMTRGGRWPDGEPCVARNVVIWSGEDDRRSTLSPRLIKSGADMSKIFFVDTIDDATGSREFDPAKDMPHLANEMRKMDNIGLLIIDPIVSAISGDSHKNNEVRRGLQPLVTLAKEANCAVIGISHFTKGTQGKDPIERITGSIAFGALARLVFAAVKTVDENNCVRRLFVRAKSNISKDYGGFEYSLPVGTLPGKPEIESTHAEFGDYIEGSASDILHEAEQSVEDRSDSDHAKQFLRDYLGDGPRDVKSINNAAKQAGVSQTALKRAKSALKIKSNKMGFGSGWEWSLE